MWASNSNISNAKSSFRWISNGVTMPEDFCQLSVIFPPSRPSKICPKWTSSVPRNSCKQFSEGEVQLQFPLDHRSQKTAGLLLRTDNVQILISENIFAPNGGYFYICCWLFNFKTNLHTTIYLSDFLHCLNCLNAQFVVYFLQKNLADVYSLNRFLICWPNWSDKS